MPRYVFDYEKFQKIIISSNEDEFTKSYLINAIVKSFNAEQFSFYYILESIKYYMDNDSSMKLCFEYTYYYFLKAFLIIDENVDGNSEQVININEKMNKIWKSILNHPSTQFIP